MKGKTNLNGKAARRRKGYTILELVAVIGVLAALTAISVPTFNSVRSKIDIKNCNQNKYIIFKTYQNEHKLDENVTLKNVCQDSYFMKGRGRQGGLFFNSRIQCNGENYVYTGENEAEGYVPTIADIHCNHHEGKLTEGADLFGEYASVVELISPTPNVTIQINKTGNGSQIKQFLNDNQSYFTEDQKAIYEDAVDRGLFDTDDGAKSVIDDLNAAAEDGGKFLITTADNESGSTDITLDFSSMSYGDGSGTDFSQYVENGRFDVSGFADYMKSLYDSGALNDAQKTAYEKLTGGGKLSKDDAAVRAYLMIVKYKGEPAYFTIGEGTNAKNFYVSQTMGTDAWKKVQAGEDASNYIVTVAQDDPYASGTSNVKYVLYDNKWYEWQGKDYPGNGQYQDPETLAKNITDVKKWKVLDPQPTLTEPYKTSK